MSTDEFSSVLGPGRGGGLPRSNDPQPAFELRPDRFAAWLDALADEWGEPVSERQLSDFGELLHIAVERLVVELADHDVLRMPDGAQLWAQPIEDTDAVPLLITVSHRDLPALSLTTMPLEAHELYNGDLNADTGPAVFEELAARVAAHASELWVSMRVLLAHHTDRGA